MGLHYPILKKKHYLLRFVLKPHSLTAVFRNCDCKTYDTKFHALWGGKTIGPFFTACSLKMICFRGMRPRSALSVALNVVNSNNSSRNKFPCKSYLRVRNSFSAEITLDTIFELEPNRIHLLE